MRLHEAEGSLRQLPCTRDGLCAILRFVTSAKGIMGMREIVAGADALLFILFPHSAEYIPDISKDEACYDHYYANHSREPVVRIQRLPVTFVR